MFTLKQLFDASKRKWGLDSQILQLVEELNELAVATLHLMRNSKPTKESLEHFAEEIADVELMIAEMKYYFENDGLVTYYRMQKEQRLEKILRKSGK